MSEKPLAALHYRTMCAAFTSDRYPCARSVGHEGDHASVYGTQPNPPHPSFWDALGVDDGGLPIHLPFSHNSVCQGPTSDAEAHHWSCWCRDGHDCPLSKALALAFEAGQRFRKGTTRSSRWDGSMTPEDETRNGFEEDHSDLYPDGRPKMHRHTMSDDVHRDDECSLGVRFGGEWNTSRRRVYVFDDDYLPLHERYISARVWQEAHQQACGYYAANPSLCLTAHCNLNPYAGEGDE